MSDSKKAASRMLDEDTERQAMRRMMRQAQKEEKIFCRKKAQWAGTIILVFTLWI